MKSVTRLLILFGFAIAISFLFARLYSQGNLVLTEAAKAMSWALSIPGAVLGFCYCRLLGEKRIFGDKKIEKICPVFHDSNFMLGDPGRIRPGSFRCVDESIWKLCAYRSSRATSQRQREG